MARLLLILCCLLSCLCMYGNGNQVFGQLSPYLKARYASLRQETDANETTTHGSMNVLANDCVCSKIYDPVCGTDDKSYYNLCQLQCTAESNVSVVHQGNCIPF